MKAYTFSSIAVSTSSVPICVFLSQSRTLSVDLSRAAEVGFGCSLLKICLESDAIPGFGRPASA